MGRKPVLFLDDGTPGRERLRVFERLRAVICAREPEQVPKALAAAQKALEAGSYVAGYLSYELGYPMEAKLRQLLPASSAPLLWLGVFDDMAQVEGEAVADFFARRISGRAYAGPLRHEWSGEDYRARFDAARAYIAAGDIYQANLSFRSRFVFAGDPLALYCRMRASSGAANGAFVEDGSRTILSLSPELFFRISCEGRIETRPMKGTAPRGDDPISDAAACNALAASAKNRAENLMIVDLMRNDLGRIAELGTVDAPALFSVEIYPTLLQLVSTVTANLRAGTTAEAVIRALFPCGSVTGAPKIRAMEIIRALETSPRGAYCGAIGYFAPDGSARFNVAIRTATIEGGEGRLGIGGAIVQDSEATAEYAECLLKARFFEAARKPIELIETLRFNPDGGLIRVDLHLARMERSARALGLPFEITRARDALEMAVADAQAPLRVRLLLDEVGVYSVTVAALPPSPEHWTYAISPVRVASADVLARHKTSWRDLYESEHARLAHETGCDETLFLNEKGEIVEGSRTNVFIRKGSQLVTPLLSSGTLDGCLRRALIEEGACVGAVLWPSDLSRGDPVYFGNSLRGLIMAKPIDAASPLVAAADF